jgi:hypothetical protein
MHRRALSGCGEGSLAPAVFIHSREASLKDIPNTENALVLRTEFSDDAAWQAVCAAIREPVDGFLAYVDFLDDPRYDGVTAGQVVGAVPPEYEHSFIFIVDDVTLSRPDHPILVVDLLDEPGRTFRAIPSCMASIENNLSIANMAFEDYAESVDPDGVHRGFREY